MLVWFVDFVGDCGGIVGRGVGLVLFVGIFVW